MRNVEIIRVHAFYAFVLAIIMGVIGTFAFMGALWLYPPGIAKVICVFFCGFTLFGMIAGAVCYGIFTVQADQLQRLIFDMNDEIRKLTKEHSVISVESETVYDILDALGKGILTKDDMEDYTKLKGKAKQSLTVAMLQSVDNPQYPNDQRELILSYWPKTIDEMRRMIAMDMMNPSHLPFTE